FRPRRTTGSHETLDRILDAPERLLDEKSFTEATLAEIMERAGVTVGAFYRRFPDKDALLHLLDERFFREMQARADELLDPNHWQGASISEILSEFARTAVNVYTTRRGVARSLFLRARVDPVIQATARQVNARCIERLRALLLDPGRRAEVTVLADVDRFFTDNETRIRDELFELLRIPSVSARSEHNADTTRAAEWVAASMRAAGLQATVHRTPGHPVVVGEWRGAGANAPTILAYGHYDVQPAEPLDLWTSPPFEPTVRSGKIFARGSVDDKGQ